MGFYCPNKYTKNTIIKCKKVQFSVRFFACFGKILRFRTFLTITVNLLWLSGANDRKMQHFIFYLGMYKPPIFLKLLYKK
jgi:hypothetical protein